MRPVGSAVQIRGLRMRYSNGLQWEAVRVREVAERADDVAISDAIGGLSSEAP